MDLTEHCLGRIGTYNPKVNAFITVLAEQARARARELDDERRAGRRRGPLHGIPIAIKDNIDTAGTRTTAGSALFDERVPGADAEVVRRLREAGAIVIGKANMHEFATGGSCTTSYFGPVRNPWAPDYISGGSSGGVAAALAADLCFAGVATDSGGSIRTPAAHCGVVGLKPTYGLVSMRGIVPLSPTLDHCGPLARSVGDAALLLDVLAGFDKRDPASVDRPRIDHLEALDRPVKALRVGVPRAPFFDLLDADVEDAVEAALGVLARLTRGLTEARLPPTLGIGVVGIECYVYHEDYLAHSADRYHATTRRSLESAAQVRAVDYLKARWKLDLLRRTVDEAFVDFDVIALPTRRRLATTIDVAREKEVSDEAHGPEVENTWAFNLYGIPAISIPCGFSKSGLPIGLTLAGPPFSEPSVLALANAYEQATEWHTRRPRLTPSIAVPPRARR